VNRPERKTGTREWSEHSANCCLGCRHGCLYCYARLSALRFGRIENGEDWTNERPDADVANFQRRKYKGIVMFPTTHDITRGTAAVCLTTLVNLLDAGNRVLVVSKANMAVLTLLELVKRLGYGGGTLELRVSLTCLDPRIAAFWEPGAPDPRKRLVALDGASMLGIPTSISIEPLLDPDAVAEIVQAAHDVGVHGEIWIGAANHLRARTAWCRGSVPELEKEIARLEECQTPERMRAVYETLKADPQIRWKDSYQRALGIDAFGRAQAGTS
jgi:DNA repair photolyase